MKTARFCMMVLLLLLARGCDFYSTALWFNDAPHDEMNPLIRLFDLGWTGIILSNVSIVSLVIFAFYFYTYHYQPKKLAVMPSNFKEYVSRLYYNEPGKFYHLSWRMPKNKMAMIAHSGYVFIRGLIIFSLLAGVHNMCQYYEVPLYADLRTLVGSPLLLFGIIGLSSIAYFYYCVWQQDYHIVQVLDH